MLDIVFEGRNKEYGAYPLRKYYRHRLFLSLLLMALLTSMIIVFAWTISSKDGATIRCPVSGTLHPEQLPHTVAPPVDPASVHTVRPPRVRNVEIPRARVINVAKLVGPPVLIADEVPPPMQTNMDNVSGSPGVAAGVTDAPAEVEAAGSSSGEQPAGNDARVFAGTESAYPGGLAAWQRFLLKTVQYPVSSKDAGEQGTIIIEFIVDTTGAVSGIHALNGPERLAAEAERVIRRSGRWIPATQNGRRVTSRKQQPIVFRLEGE